MAPKKKGEGKKKKKSARPPWMSEEMYDLSQNLPKLTEFWSGEVKDNKKGGGKDAAKANAKPVPTITRTQAGLFIWQLLYPNNKAAKEKREECVKLGMIECTLKVLASGKHQDMTPACGILTALVADNDQQRQVMLDTKPNPVPHLLTALAATDSAPLKAAICALMRVMASKDETRPRLWRALKEWDWAPLIGCLGLQDVSQLGGRNACHDAMAALEALCVARDKDKEAGEVGWGACTRVVQSGGIKAIIQVLEERVSHPMARAAGINILNLIMRRAPSSLCEDIVIGQRGLKPTVALLDHPVVPLLYKAYATAVLLRYIMPDSLWKDSSSLAGPRPKTAGGSSSAPPSRAKAVAADGLGGTSPPGMAGVGAAGELGPATLPSIADPSLVAPATPGGPQGESPPGTAAGGARGLTQQVNTALESRPGTSMGAEGGSGPGPQGPPEPVVPDDQVLSEEVKAEILARARVVAEAGALPAIIKLCVGPEGPLKDLEAKAAAAALSGNESPDPSGKKKKKKGGKKKKKGKLEPGMAEAQTFASAVLRLVSLGEDHRGLLVAGGVMRYILPLMESKIHPARWNTRQTLINLSMTPSLMPTLLLYKVPDYIHGANIPASHFQRPFPTPPGMPPGMPPTLSSSGAAGGAGLPPLTPGARGKPPALKPIRVDGAASGGTAASTPSAAAVSGSAAAAVAMMAGPPGPSGVPHRLSNTNVRISDGPAPRPSESGLSPPAGEASIAEAIVAQGGALFLG